MITPDQIERFEKLLQPDPVDFENARFILLNGPPYSGKDTAGAAITKEYDSIGLKFSEPLKRAVFIDAGLPYMTPIDSFDKVKDVKLALFGGRSFRQACIDKSEREIKPQYGPSHFGLLLAKAAGAAIRASGADLFVVTDSGFAPEAEELMLYAPRQQVLLMRIHAEKRGCTFKSDSRGYIELPGVVSIDLQNDAATPEPFVADVLDALDAWMTAF